jgi:ferric-dicitrate binding protein FerR (iron transport regulator)
MTTEKYMELYEKFLAGNCTSAEKKELLEYQDKLTYLDAARIPDPVGTEAAGERVLHRLQNISKKKSASIYSSRLWWAAAMLLFISSISLLFFSKKNPTISRESQMIVLGNQPQQPRTRAVILTMSDGSSIQLDKAPSGILAINGRTVLKKLENGELDYIVNHDNIESGASLMNTISIPRGNKYKINLPDGTKVWLNSESSLSYPMRFSGKERLVKLIGEAYFEVTKNKAMPFKVVANNVNIEVLGTHFNVNAYTNNKKVGTTLLEGSVKLSSGGSVVQLKPGEKGSIETGSEKFSVQQVKQYESIAWIKGYFIFRNSDIKEVMNEIARWYDVDIEYSGSIINGYFGGIYAKDKSLDELLKSLELTGLVHFKINGRRIIVSI